MRDDKDPKRKTNKQTKKKKQKQKNRIRCVKTRGFEINREY